MSDWVFCGDESCDRAVCATWIGRRFGKGGDCTICCSDILDRLLGPGQRLSIFLSRPCLELIEQSFGSCPIDVGLILKGGSKSGSQFIARWLAGTASALAVD